MEKERIVLLDEYLRNAQKKDIDYLLMLSSNKFLYEFYKVSGLEPVADCGYGGWERSDGVNFRGHFFGHYMTALSQAYLCVEEEECRNLIISRIRDAVNGLMQCQQAYAVAHPKSAGYVSPFRESALDKVEGSGNSDENVLVPWYNLHKILSGLLSIAINVAQEREISQTALTVAEKLGEYIYSVRTSAWSEDIRKKVLQVEYGGMNEALYILYELTGRDIFEKAAHAFDETELFERILEQGDILNGKHANTMIPKFIGAVRRFMILKDKSREEEKYLQAAIKFWDIVVSSHTYITGGNSYSEHFNAPDTLATHLGSRNCETCNAHNMLKLSRLLFNITDDIKYMNFSERLFINSILPAQNPKSGMMTYFQPMETGFYKLYNRPFEHFWCCTGTGIENYTKMGENIFWYRKEILHINLYMSAIYKNHGMEVEIQAHLPEEDSVKVFIRKNTNGRSIKFRIPDWTDGNYTISVNGVSADTAVKNGYWECGEGKEGDCIVLTFEQHIKCDRLKDNPCYTAFSYGAYVLGCGLGIDDIDKEENTGILVKVPYRNYKKNYTVGISGKSTDEWIGNAEQNFVRVSQAPLSFSLKGTDCGNLIFRPYYRLHGERYGIYLHFADKEELKRITAKKTLIIDEIPFFDYNNMEYGHNLKFEEGETGVFRGRSYRKSSKWFSYDMEIAEGIIDQVLKVTFHIRDAGNKVRIIFNDKREIVYCITRDIPSDKDGCCSVVFEVPAEFLSGMERRTGTCESQRGKGILTVKFETVDMAEIRVFGIAVAKKSS